MNRCGITAGQGVHSAREERRQLTLLMTRRMSLDKWSRLGILRRELALYERLSENGIDVVIVSYGGAEELAHVQQFPWLTLCYNHWGLPRWLYLRSLPFQFGNILRRTTWFKTNQASGGSVAVSLARRFQRPLIARMGYLWSDTEMRRHGEDSVQVHAAQREEELLYCNALQVVVTTRSIRDSIAERAPELPGDRIRVIPNFVETRQFQPQPNTQPTWDLIYVGRMSVEKNVSWILDAAERSNWRVLLIGSADADLPHAFRLATRSSRVRWIPTVANEDLPTFLTQARAFVSASQGEGHPKAMLEALACGVPVVATKVPGVQDLFEHRKTAFLCHPSRDDLHQGIHTLLEDPSLQQEIGRQGRDFVEQHFSLTRVAELELQMLNESRSGPKGAWDGRVSHPMRLHTATSA